MSAGWNIGLVIAAFVATEAVAWFTHKYIMHGIGWGWHRSHHQPRQGLFERNDWYAVGFSIFVVGLFAVGALLYAPAWYIALGITLYGIVYVWFHDGVVHRRWPMPRRAPRGYLKTLVQAHHLHHASHEREGAVAFGFLWMRDLDAEVQAFKRARSGRRRLNTP